MQIGNKIRTVLYVGLAALVVNCATGVPKQEYGNSEPVIFTPKCNGAPEWYLKGIDNDRLIWGYGVASSPELDTAQIGAEDMARGRIAEKKGGTKQFNEARIMSVNNNFYCCKEENGDYRVYIESVSLR